MFVTFLMITLFSVQTIDGFSCLLCEGIETNFPMFEKGADHKCTKTFVAECQIMGSIREACMDRFWFREGKWWMTKVCGARGCVQNYCTTCYENNCNNKTFEDYAEILKQKQKTIK